MTTKSTPLKRTPLVIPLPSTGTGKTFQHVMIGKKGYGRTSHFKNVTPFLDIDKEVILVGDLIRSITVKKGQKPKKEKPMKVCFGEYKAGRDDFDVDYIVYGFYIEFHDGGVYSLTQEGKGYSIAAMNCRIVKKK